MDKNAIKKYAVWARNELIARVTQKAQQYGITVDDIVDANADSINGNLLTATEKKQRQALIKKIEVEGFEQVMEEVAYTWFNRFTALRFMEVNNYLPSHVRVFTNDENEFKPQILAEAINLELDGLDMDKVFELKDANKDEELYKYLLIVQCNALNDILPRMFQKIADYTELLLPDYLLREGSVIDEMISIIPENDWTDKVQIIGWLYQYYNAEKKDQVFAALKKKVKISKENVPAATQIFTPDWVVRYMTENSLGRFWVENHPSEELKTKWEYFLDEPIQNDKANKVIEELRDCNKSIPLEELVCIDPCMGSGHIITYMFDVLVQIYECCGYTASEAARHIAEKNIYGLDIDERAAQLAYFSIMMKGCQYDRRFLKRKIEPNVYAIRESNNIDSYVIDYFCDGDIQLKKSMDAIVSEMHDAKEYGSILKISTNEWERIFDRFEEIKSDISMYRELALEMFDMVKIAKMLSQKYHIVITNPPYMGTNGMDAKLAKYVKENYPISKTDMFSVFIDRCQDMVSSNGYVAMITQPSVLFLSSFSKLREKMITDGIICSLLHMGRGIFGIDFGSTAFVMKNGYIPSYKGSYFKLYERTFQYIDPLDIAKLFKMAKGNLGFKYNFSAYESQNFELGNSVDDNENALQIYYEFCQDNFLRLPSYPMAYWISDKLLDDFYIGKPLKDCGDTRQGMATSDNNRFLRLWYEVDINKTGFSYETAEEANDSNNKWFPYNKGGDYRKWYGNMEYVINYENDGEEVKGYATELYKTPTRTIKSMSEYFKSCLSWSKISAGSIGFRYYPEGFIFDVAGCCIFYQSKDRMLYDFGFLNSCVAKKILEAISPTLNYEAGHVAALPVIYKQEQNEKISDLVEKCIAISKDDWDSYETSWDFKSNYLIDDKYCKIEDAYEQHKKNCQQKVNALTNAEEAINEIFIQIYDLQNEMKATVENVLTLREPILRDDIIEFISYSVGCMFGRYSLDGDGLMYAGGSINKSLYERYNIDSDNIIPICDDEYFDDDIVGLFVDFVENVYGKETLEENLKFIAFALGGKGSAREIIRSYFINDFYKEHCKMYQKKPIYWLFDSGKKNGFKCLIYMHRYQSDTIARIRTDYVHEQQSRYRTVISDIEQRISNASTSERVKLNKQLKKIKDQADELLIYEEKIHHLADQMIDIDLDDGVKVNYAKFQDVLAKIK